MVSFQAVKNEYIELAARAGKASGRVIFAKVCTLLAPNIMDASSSSLLIPMKILLVIHAVSAILGTE